MRQKKIGKPSKSPGLAISKSLSDKTYDIQPGRVIRERRDALGLKAVDLARKASINPGTLDAIEKGRVQTPSLPMLVSLAKALEISVASLFSEEGNEAPAIFQLGNLKGLHTLEFPKNGFRIIRYTPVVRDCFIGKVILNGQTRINHDTLPTSGMIFVQAIIGKLIVCFDGRENLIREGNYAFFDGHFKHSFCNPQPKENSFFLVTVPSFLV
jgi:transcriptional regulator with XRE-family HTH domain